jgi:serine/threonine-protein kinase
VKRINLPDGVPRVLADAPSGRGGTWNADSVVVYAPATVGPLMRIPATGEGTPQPVTRVAIDRGSHRWPRFLPDDRRFTFCMALAPADVRGTDVGSFDSADARRVLPNENAAVHAPPGVLVSVYQTTLVAVPFDLEAGNVIGEPIMLAEDVGVAGGSWRGAFATSDAGAPGLALAAGSSLGTILV